MLTPPFRRPLPTIGSRRWIFDIYLPPGARRLFLTVGQRQQLVLEILGVTSVHGLFEQLFNDWQEEMQGPDRRQRRSTLAAEGTASGSEDKSGLNDSERHAALVKRSRQPPVVAAGACRRPWEPEVAIKDRFEVDAAGIGA